MSILSEVRPIAKNAHFLFIFRGSVGNAAELPIRLALTNTAGGTHRPWELQADVLLAKSLTCNYLNYLLLFIYQT